MVEQEPNTSIYPLEDWLMQILVGIWMFIVYAQNAGVQEIRKFQYIERPFLIDTMGKDTG